MIEASYAPQDLEQKWYAKWLESGVFNREITRERLAYAIVIPPPNVTGILHMGHVLNNTIQDVLIRRARQKGQSALWILGTDHAGISLQVKVEKELAKQGQTRQEIGREAFLEKAKNWRDHHGHIILEQLKKLGISGDWSLVKHTLDHDYSQAVLSVFVKLYRQGYIYKGSRFVNWCPVSMTALSDEEVIMRQQNALLYYVRYDIVEKPGEFIIVATTRPETIMGDVAIAVNPSDKRHQDRIGLHCWRPIIREPIPIIADEAVLEDFGSGALKITPAHDQVDFEIGQRHGLKTICIIEKDGKLNEQAGEDFCGMDRFEARQKVVDHLREIGLLLREEPYVNRVGYSERAGVPVEPMLSEQWFLKYPRIEEAKMAVEEGFIKFRPEHWSKTYLHWLNNIKDWCISRQLWWGHRIPVWYKKNANRNDPKNWHVSVDGPEDPWLWEQDEDVLDTWFSSAIWPLATLGWPDEKAMAETGFDYFYPTTDLVTGPDIIFFWVARMIISGLTLLGPQDGVLSRDEIQQYIPFENVYFMGMVRDQQGRKMSKSLGNSPDPLDLIEQYGADGVRIGLLSIAPKGQDIFFSEDCIAQGKKLCTKLWNAFRFRQQNNMEGDRSSMAAILERIDGNVLEIDDLAVLGKLITTTDDFENAMASYDFNRAVQILQSFFWGYFCDWYIEISKLRIHETVLAIHDFILRQLLLLFHPFIPFITEALWHDHGYGKQLLAKELLVSGQSLRGYLSHIDLQNVSMAIREIEAVQELVAKARSLKAQYGLSSHRDIQFFFRANESSKPIIERHLEHIKHMLLTRFFDQTEAILQLPTDVMAWGSISIDISKNIDIEAEQGRLRREIDQLNQWVVVNQNKLHNERFLSNAPDDVIRGVRYLLAENITKRGEFEAALLNLSRNSP